MLSLGHHVIQCEPVAIALQVANAYQELGRDLDRFQHLQHHLVFGKEADEVAEQHTGIHIDESKVLAKHAMQTQLGCMGDH